MNGIYRVSLDKAAAWNDGAIDGWFLFSGKINIYMMHTSHNQPHEAYYRIVK